MTEQTEFEPIQRVSVPALEENPDIRPRGVCLWYCYRLACLTRAGLST